MGLASLGEGCGWGDGGGEVRRGEEGWERERERERESNEGHKAPYPLGRFISRPFSF